MPYTVVDCGNLTNPSNGEVIFSSTTLSSLAEYSCDQQSGYLLTQGTGSVRTCQADGTWSGSEPSCVCSGAGFTLEDGANCVQSVLVILLIVPLHCMYVIYAFH